MKLDFLKEDSNFLGLAENYSAQNSKFVIQQLPYEHTSSYLLGSSKGPEAIINASHFVEFYDEELEKEACFENGICTLKALPFKQKVNEEALELIYNQTKVLLAQNKFIVSLGAEHTVSYGIIKAFKEEYNELSILQIDAHSDLRQSYQGNKWSHASVMARCMELNPEQLVQVGIRALCKEEAETIKKTPNIHTTYAHQMGEENWQQTCIDNLSDNVYITIDADGFDPSIMPAVGTAEPNGLLWNDALQLLSRTFKTKNVVGFDIVECAPREGDTLTEYNLAKLTYKLIGLKK